MKTCKKIAVFVLIIASNFILIIYSVHSDQAYAIFEKSDLMASAIKDRSVQETSKYHYVGTEKCASVCHNNEEMGFQYNMWQKSRHSESYISLTSKRAARYSKNAGVKGNPQESSVCLKCHVTGGGLDSSFFATTYKKKDGVTCEACHKGEYIIKTFLPKATDCLKCHNESVHKIPEFDFNDKYAIIAHPRPKAAI